MNNIHLKNILTKQVVIGLSYFDISKQLLNQKQLMGKVIGADVEQGITILLPDKSPFIIPANLSPWFNAPKGHYIDKKFGVDIINPDYLITWDIYQKQQVVKDKNHQWWDWIPRISLPEIGKTQKVL